VLLHSFNKLSKNIVTSTVIKDKGLLCQDTGKKQILKY